MGERIALRGGWYEFVEDFDEPEFPEDEEQFFLPVSVVDKMAVFCRYNNTTKPQ